MVQVRSKAQLDMVNPIAYQYYRELPSNMFADSNPTSSHDPTLIELNHMLLDQLVMRQNN